MLLHGKMEMRIETNIINVLKNAFASALKNTFAKKIIILLVKTLGVLTPKTTIIVLVLIY